MQTQDFSTTVLVDQSPEAAYAAINNVRGWWSENIEGSTDTLNGEFDYHYQDVHRCKIRVTALVPGKKVAWQVIENYFSFTKDESEWTGTSMLFEITEKNGQTQIRLTHQGLVPTYECYQVCTESWTSFVQRSLKSLITTGKGMPNPKSGDSISAQVVEKHHLKG
ncbi:SRPBCC domain-containing protein [uncultured Chitinophaga sp.]|uniref:SRPBCC family protein n=1 Tax=uncultured Chitinophaga sp. TaxID=339340 RepID=UPI0025D3B8B7|nr:SRPBCC domain-containing protein [uncultured Chitinophaga sp.]